MKKKIFAIIAVVLCLSMLFASCKKKDEGEEATTKSKEDVILGYLNGDGSSLSDIEGTAYDMIADLNLEMTNIKVDGEKFIDSAILSGGALYMKSGENVMYMLIDKSLETLNLSYGADGVDRAIISASDDSQAEDAADVETPEITDADLVDEGNGVYSLSREYLNKVFEAVMVAYAGDEAEDETFKEEMNTFLDMLDDTDMSMKITVDGEQITKVEETFKADKAVCTAFITEISGIPDLGLDYFVDVTSVMEFEDGLPKKMTANIDMCYPVDTISDEGKMGVALVSTGGDVVIDLTKLDATATVADIKTYTNMSVKGFKQSGDKYVADATVTNEYKEYYGETKQELEISIKEGKFNYSNTATSGSDSMKQACTADVSFEKKAIPELSADAKAYVNKADKVFKNMDAIEKHATDIGNKIAAKATSDMKYGTILYKYAEYDVYVEYYLILVDENKFETRIEGYTFIDEGYADYMATVSGSNVTITPVTPAY